MNSTVTLLGDAAVTSTNGDVLYEVVDGVVREMPPMSAYETSIASVLHGVAWPFARSHNLGRVVSEMLFSLAATPRLQRRPDVAFVSEQRWPRNRPIPRTNAWDVVPNLAVEVISPTEFAVEVLTKVREYFQAGVEQVWVVYPTERLVYVYESPTLIRVLTAADELLGDPILPGFRLPIAVLFEETSQGI